MLRKQAKGGKMLQKLLEGQAWELVMNDEEETFLVLNCNGYIHTTHLSRTGSSDWFFREMFEFMAFVNRHKNDNMLSFSQKEQENGI